MHLNCVNLSRTYIQNKPISFKSSEDCGWYDEFSQDTFYSSRKKPKKKWWEFTNPIKQVKRQSAIILDEAEKEAQKIIEKAQKDAASLSERLAYEARVKAQQEAYRAYDEQSKLLEKDFDRYRTSLEQKYQLKQTQLILAQKQAEEKLEQTRELIAALNQGFIDREIEARKALMMSYLDDFELDYDYNAAQRSKIEPFEAPKDSTDISHCVYFPPERQAETRLSIPEFDGENSWYFEVPRSDKINYPEYIKMPFDEIYNHETNISMNYADSIKWNVDKIARDLMQNFFDGHGQTLDGVRLSFEKQDNGKYKVRIEGDAQYSQEKAILLGESTKRNDSRAAGNFGEGLKVVVLKLLKEYGAQEVNISSDDWRVNFKPQESKICKKDILSYSLLHQDEIDGNYIEFETDNMELLQALRKSINNFYHSNNPDFQNFSFENDLFAIKLLNKDEQGSIYIAGQKFEFYNEHTVKMGWDTLDGVVVLFKEKPKNTDKFDISRDRIMLQRADLKNILQNFIVSPKTSKEDAAKLLLMFNKYWEKASYGSDKSDAVIQDIFSAILNGISTKGLKFKFGANCIAASQKYFDQKENIYKGSYRICKNEFARLGMIPIETKYRQDQPQALVEPNEFEIKKIGIIKEVLKVLEPHILRADYKYSSSNFNPNIYIFKEGGIFSGEHRSDGFWIGRGELKSPFERVLAVAIHEICHDYGGDGDANFTYALTDMLQALIRAVSSDEKTLVELRTLKACWSEVCTQERNSYLA